MFEPTRQSHVSFLFVICLLTETIMVKFVCSAGWGWACIFHVRDLDRQHDWVQQQTFPGWVAFHKICWGEAHTGNAHTQGEAAAEPSGCVDAPDALEKQQHSQQHRPPLATTNTPGSGAPVVPAGNAHVSTWSMRRLFSALPGRSDAPGLSGAQGLRERSPKRQRL